MKLTGDWLNVTNITRQLEKIGQDAMAEGLAKTGLFAEGQSKKHISNQDLNWKPLKKDYKDMKSRRGFSTNILVKSSAYFQSITSWSKGKTGLCRCQESS